MSLAFLLLFLSIPHATSFAAAGGGGGGCNRKRGGTTVPYPFGFSGDCPIILAFNQTAGTALLPRGYPILSFDRNASTLVVSVATSCDRTVAETRASLSGAGFGVSSRTGIFVGGGRCSAAPPAAASTCTVPSDLMAEMLRTAGCGGAGGRNGTASWTCVASAPPEPSSAAAARGEGQFMRWDRVEAAGCEDALTAALYGDTPRGVPSVEFSVAELGWWLDGRCDDAAGGGRCAGNATCRDVVTPDGAWGHRCACRDGMVGDGFVAGEGCHFGVPPPAGECFLNHCCCALASSRDGSRTHACHSGSPTVLVWGPLLTRQPHPGQKSTLNVDHARESSY